MQASENITGLWCLAIKFDTQLHKGVWSKENCEEGNRMVCETQGMTKGDERVYKENCL